MLDDIICGDLPFRHTRPYFEWERNRGDRVDDTAVQVCQTSYPAHEADLRPKRLDPGLIAFNDFDPHDIAPYNRLVISLISAAASRKLKRVLIASAQHGDGRTAVTLNLAATLARARKRVLVVESDFLRPAALRLLGIDSAMGLAEAVAKGLAPSKAMVWLQPIGFNLLPTCAQVENSAELLASPSFDVMMRTLSPEFDFVLFDSAPLLAAADARLLEHHTDATLIVIRQGASLPVKWPKPSSTQRRAPPRRRAQPRCDLTGFDDDLEGSHSTAHSDDLRRGADLFVRRHGDLYPVRRRARMADDIADDILVLASFYLFDLHDFSRIQRRGALLLRLSQSLVIVGLALALMFYIWPQIRLSSDVFPLTLLLTLPFMATWRSLARRLLGHPRFAHRVHSGRRAGRGHYCARDAHAPRSRIRRDRVRRR